MHLRCNPINTIYYGIHMVSTVYPKHIMVLILYNATIFLTLWYPNGIQMVSKWYPNGIQMVSKWYPNGIHRVSKAYYGINII
jgi:hypothetical protein